MIIVIAIKGGCSYPYYQLNTMMPEGLLGNERTKRESRTQSKRYCNSEQICSLIRARDYQKGQTISRGKY